MLLPLRRWLLFVWLTLVCVIELQAALEKMKKRLLGAFSHLSTSSTASGIEERDE